MSDEITKNIQKIKGDIKRLGAKIDGHIGDNGDAHRLVEFGEAGFMSPGQAANLDQLFSGRKAITDGTTIDIDDLAPGFYVAIASQVTGLPPTISTTSVVTIDVSNYRAGKLSFVLREGWNTRIWIRDLHAPDATTDEGKSVGWILLSGSVLLWSGASTSGVLNFAESRISFQYLVILYRNDAGNRGTVKILRETNETSLTMTNQPDDDTISILHSEAKITIADTSITIGKNSSVWVSGTSDGSSDSKITITTIIGVNG